MTAEMWIISFANRWDQDLYSGEFSKWFETYDEALKWFLSVKNSMQDFWERTFPSWTLTDERGYSRSIQISTNITDEERLEKQLDLQYEITCGAKKVGVYLIGIRSWEAEKQ